MKKLNAKRMDLVLVPSEVKQNRAFSPLPEYQLFLWLSRSSWYSNATALSLKEYFPLCPSLNPQTPDAQRGIPSLARVQDCAQNQLNKTLTHFNQPYKQ